jgi:methylated-DNA-[protein]-cysteine S-methyltransferase
VDQTTYKSPLGPLYLWWHQGRLVYASFDEGSGAVWLKKRFPKAHWEPRTLEKRYQEDLDRYFRGEKIQFNWPLELLGTNFQQRVWREIAAVPHGQVTTYKRIAEALGTRAYRAVGQAAGANPVSVIVPCHRVLGTHSFGGYGGGLNLKRLLLELESVTLAPYFFA